MTEPSHNPFAVPKPPPRRGARTVKPSERDLAWKISIHWQSWKAIMKGRKTCNIVPYADEEWARKVRRGHRLKMIARREPTKPAIPCEVLSVCHHETLADIPSCDVGHDPERILPHAPLWADVLQRAAVGGVADKATGTLEERGQQGWVVVEFRKSE